MLLIAGAFAALNRADPDFGTTFSWVTRALGPWAGWIAGWAITRTGAQIILSLANAGVVFPLRTPELASLAEYTAEVLVLTVLLALLTALGSRGERELCR